MAAKREMRSAKILELLAERKRLEVTNLAGLLGVSQVTIRKDLDELETKGFVKRIHGYAELENPDNISGRLAYHYEEKRKIAGKAAELIKDGDTVMIENGSCCALLADILGNLRKNITIVTNSAFIAEYVREFANLQVVLLGGIYQGDSQCLVGPMIRDGARHYHVEYFFIGTDGWSEGTGFTNKDQMRAQAVRDMAHSAEKIVVLTESEKFLHAGTIPMNLKGQPKMLITDQNISEAVVQILAQDNIQTFCVV